MPNHDLAAPVESSEGRAKPPKLLAFISSKKEISKAEINRPPISQSESRDVMFEIQATILNPVCISKVSSKMLGQCYLSPVRSEKGPYYTTQQL